MSNVVSITKNKTNKMLVIGLTGKAGCGKDTLAREVMHALYAMPEYAEATFVISPLAYHLHEMVGDIARYTTANAELSDDLLKPEVTTDEGLAQQIQRTFSTPPLASREVKEAPLPGLGYNSPRTLMQHLGTEWGRDEVSPDIWINMVKGSIKVARAVAEEGALFVVIIPDVRFSNEVDMVRELGGKVYSIERAQQELILSTNHATEMGLPKEDIDIHIEMLNDTGDGNAISTATSMMLDTVLPDLAQLTGSMEAAIEA